MGIVYIRKKRQPNRLQDAFHISVDIRIGKSKYPIAEHAQCPIASGITHPIPIEAMLHAVHFYDQPSSPTFESTT